MTIRRSILFTDSTHTGRRERGERWRDGALTTTRSAVNGLALVIRLALGERRDPQDAAEALQYLCQRFHRQVLAARAQVAEHVFGQPGGLAELVARFEPLPRDGLELVAVVSVPRQPCRDGDARTEVLGDVPDGCLDGLLARQAFRAGELAHCLQCIVVEIVPFGPGRRVAAGGASQRLVLTLP